MNKRGEISLRVIFIPVAIVLLFLLLYFGGGYIKEKGQALIYLIPGFGIEKKIPDDVKIIRYDIAKDSLSYYDGVKFIALDYKKDEAFGFDSGSKKVSSKYLRQRFIDKFYNGERPKLSELIPGFGDFNPVMTSPDKNYPYFLNCVKGLSLFNLVKSSLSNGKFFVLTESRIYTFDLDDRVHTSSISQNCKKEYDSYILNGGEKGNVYGEIGEIIEGNFLYSPFKKWRDSVLTKPIEIEIEGGENVYVCVEKIGGFLSLDLDEEVDSEYECSSN